MVLFNDVIWTSLRSLVFPIFAVRTKCALEGSLILDRLELLVPRGGSLLSVKTARTQICHPPRSTAAAYWSWFNLSGGLVIMFWGYIEVLSEFI